MSDDDGEKVFQIKNMSDFVASIQQECVSDVLDGVSMTFHGKLGEFSSLLENNTIVNSFLPMSIVDKEIRKYVFSTTLHADEVFISPRHMEAVINELSADIFDMVMMRLVDYDILELCWYREEFLWRIKPEKKV